MKLIYRGIEYEEENYDRPNLLVKTQKREIIYRGNSPRGTISPKFPWWQYIKQLFSQSKIRSTLDPITFWYDRKRKFLQDCWSLDEIEKLNLAWYLTQQREQTEALKSSDLVKLKYRGVEYSKKIAKSSKIDREQ